VVINSIIHDRWPIDFCDEMEVDSVLIRRAHSKRLEKITDHKFICKEFRINIEAPEKLKISGAFSFISYPHC
jgi:hypothetical protein